jgi:hypothetical protein
VDWKALGFYVLDRFKEPSTYIGLGGYLLAAHIQVDPDMMAQLSALGVAAASTLGIVLKEGKA